MADEQLASELAMVAEIVSAYVSNNKVDSSELSTLIQTIYLGLVKAGQPEAPAETPTKTMTAAQIKKSITPDALISFVDGRPYKTLKRHLTTNDMTVADYKAKFGLPHDYPMTAPSYSAHRSAMAKSLGLGNKGRGGGKVVEAPKAPAKGRRKPIREEAS